MRDRRLIKAFRRGPNLEELPVLRGTTGKVTAAGGSGVTVTVRGQSLADLSYVGTLPSNGDVVFIIKRGRGYLVLGKINT